MIKKALTIIVSSIILSAILTSLSLYFFAKFLGVTSTGDRNFESGMWIDNKVHQDFFPRLEMIDDLKSQYLKIGVKRSEIIKILGKPDLVINPFHLSYQLGPMGMAGSTGYLHIIFDKDQKLYLYDVQ